MDVLLRLVNLALIVGFVWFVLVLFKAVDPPDWHSAGEGTRQGVHRVAETWDQFTSGFSD